MQQTPFTFDLKMPPGLPDPYDNHIVRKLSAMQGMYLDAGAYAALLAQGDDVHYEVYEIVRPAAASERANISAARIGPTVCELDGPMPILKMSKTLRNMRALLSSASNTRSPVLLKVRSRPNPWHARSCLNYGK